MTAIGTKKTVTIPKSFKYCEKYQGMTFEGTVVKINKKSYEVKVEVNDGFMCVLIKRKEY